MSVAAFDLLVRPLATSLVGLVPVAGVALVASLLPDIDSDESSIRQATGTARHSGVVGRIVSFMLRIFGGHRAITHSLLAWALLTFWVGVYFRGNMLMVAFGIGYLSHLIADALTVQGVPLLWPIFRRRISFLPSAIAIRTGGVVETLVVIAAGVAVGMLWVTRAYF
jgi:inner membrane protein